MGFIDKLLRTVGKKDFTLDPEIGKTYLFRKGMKYGRMLARGRFFSLGYRKISGTVMVGRKVRVYQKKALTVGEKTRLEDGVYIDALSRGGVSLGERVVLGRNTRIECTGSLTHIGEGVKIGDRTTFGNDCFFGAAGGIRIGDDVVAGQWIHFHSENHQYQDRTKLIREQGVSHKGIVIGNNCWIGSEAVFLDGAQIGDGCVVAAKAVVTGKFGDNEVIGGIPAHCLKKRGE